MAEILFVKHGDFAKSEDNSDPSLKIEGFKQAALAEETNCSYSYQSGAAWPGAKHVLTCFFP